MYLATASTAPVREAMSSGLLGQLRTPDSGHRVVPGTTWAADNGCFNARTFRITRWGRWLDAQPRTALWAVVPDVVADHEATLRRWHRLSPWVIARGFQPAFVAQDGCTPADIPTEAACLFVGGSTEWKLSPESIAVMREAKRRGMWVHVGRVNSRRRVRWCVDIQTPDGKQVVDSVDGTFLAYGPDVNLPRLLSWLYPEQPSFDLFGGVA